MNLITRVLQQTPRIGFSQVFRKFSTYDQFPGADNEWDPNSVESADDFENRMFGDNSENRENSNPLFRQLGRIQRAYNDSYGPTNSYGRNRYGLNANSSAAGVSENFDLDESFTTAEDGMDEKLKDAASYFQVNEEEVEKEDYSFRPDVEFQWGMTYDIKDLDLTKPAVQKPLKRYEFETTTEEVLQKADFRNVSFLTNFLTEGGIIIKRSKTRISAKAQRKIAREIKTARAFGLVPFTTMGTKRFVYGKTMENKVEDFEYETYRPHSFVDKEGNEEPLAA